MPGGPGPNKLRTLPVELHLFLPPSSSLPLRPTAADAAEVIGKVDRDVAPIMPAEDFSYMLEARPGAYMFLGNGDTPMCHHPEYNFDDEAIPAGCSYWAKLVETAMPAN